MKHISYLAIILLSFKLSSATGQTNSTQLTKKGFPLCKLTIEPAIGIHPMPTSDLVLSHLIQWNVKRHLNVVSRSSASFNTAFARNFNHVHTDYSYSLSQTIGIGTSFYLKHTSHTFSLMGGIQYDAARETLNNPDYEKVSVASGTVSPDFGLMYNLKLGKKKYFFSYRMYVPLYPYPFKTADINSIDGNLSGISFETGVGIRLK